MQPPEKLETFSWCLIPVLESVLNSKHFEKKMGFIAKVFLKLLTPKDVLTYIDKTSCSENASAVNVLRSP